MQCNYPMQMDKFRERAKKPLHNFFLSFAKQKWLHFSGITTCYVCTRHGESVLLPSKKPTTSKRTVALARQTIRKNVDVMILKFERREKRKGRIAPVGKLILFFLPFSFFSTPFFSGEVRVPFMLPIIIIIIRMRRMKKEELTSYRQSHKYWLSHTIAPLYFIAPQ